MTDRLTSTVRVLNQYDLLVLDLLEPNGYEVVTVGVNSIGRRRRAVTSDWMDGDAEVASVRDVQEYRLLIRCVGATWGDVEVAYALLLAALQQRFWLLEVTVDGVTEKYRANAATTIVSQILAHEVAAPTSRRMVDAVIPVQPERNAVRWDEPDDGGPGEEEEDIEAPTAPEGLTATVMSESRINLEWEPAVDNVGIADYRIWVDGVEVGTVSGAVLTFSVTGLASGTSYDFQVSAVDPSGNESALTTVVTATTLAPDLIAPTVPGGLSATAISTTRIDLDWTASTDAVGVTGYKVYRDGVYRATVTATDWSNTGLTADTEYDFQVLAFDDAGNESALCTAVTESTMAVVVDTTAPTVPGGLTATATSTTTIDVDWTASTDAVGVVGYKVYRDTVLAATVTSGTFWTDTGRAANTEYDYQVRAYDAAANQSALTSVVSATTFAVEEPPVVGAMLMGCSTSSHGHGGTEVWQGWRDYSSSALYSYANRTGTQRPLFMAHSESGGQNLGGANPNYTTVYNQARAQLDQFYYGGTGSTHSSRWGIKLFWSNGNENSDKGAITLPHTTAKINAYIESQRGLYDACHYAPGGVRRYPDAYAGSNPTQYHEFQGNVQGWLHASARYHDFVMWSMYPGGRTETGPDPRFDWPSLADVDRTNSQRGFLVRCFYRTVQAQAAARVATGNPSFSLMISCGEVGIGDDPGDQNTRPFYAVRGLAGPMQQIATRTGLAMPFACWWDDQSGTPENILLDEPGGTNPSTRQAWQNWPTYHPGFGGSTPAAWAGKPGNISKQTGTMP